MRTMSFKLSLVASVAAALCISACGPSQNYNGYASNNTRVCTDQFGNRVPDNRCRYVGAGNPYFFMYMNRGSYVPGYGQRVVGGYRTPMAGRSYVAPARAFAPSVSASSYGGFGSSAHGFSSGHAGSVGG